MAAKERLLLTYASRHAAGEISNNSLDRRALWMFAIPELSGALRSAWNLNNQEDFRINMLSLIREGSIGACIDLAREAFFDEESRDYFRIVALEGLKACRDIKGLRAAAQLVKAAPGRLSTRVCGSFTTILFPEYLTVNELLDLISRTSPPRPDSFEGFGPELYKLWKRCPETGRKNLLMGLAEMCLAPPFVGKYRRISARHQDLTKNLVPIAREVMLNLGNAEAPEGLVRLLMAIERADIYESDVNEEPSLSALVAENSRLRRRLFWADVEETRQNSSREEDYPTRFWHVHFLDSAPLHFGPKDLCWLFEDLSKRPQEADKRIALSAIVSILRDNNRLDFEVPRLRALVSKTSELEQDLIDYLAPRKVYNEEGGLRTQILQNRLAQEEKERKDKASWVQFREELMADPSVLCNPNCLGSLSAGGFRLNNLSRWLVGKTKKDYKKAALQWRLLREGFGRSVAEAYRDGMKVLWRVTPPERPKHKKETTVVVKYMTRLSFVGLGVEAAEDLDWALRLSKAEAERAAQHACLSEQGYPDWIEPLIDHHPDIVLPVLRKALQDEWLGRHGGHSDFFSHYSGTDRPTQHCIQQVLFEIITSKKSNKMLEWRSQVLYRLKLSEKQLQRTATLALRRLRAARVAKHEGFVRNHLAVLFLANPDGAICELADWFNSVPIDQRYTHAEISLGALFGRHSLVPSSALDGTSVASLEFLIRLAYQYVCPENDKVPEGSYTPDARNNAEEARSTLLSSLLRRPGADAYRALRTLAADSVFRLRAIRFKELAHGKAEKDSELPAWTPAEVLAFERKHITPAKTGEDLLRVVMGVLTDIQTSLKNSDTTSLPLLQRAENEDEVKQWLAEQIRFRSHGRFHTHREAQVARGDKPDLIVSSIAAHVEVAIEVKHGEKRWTVRNLEGALKNQLTGKYLKPATRRHGILVVSWHGRRTWRDPTTRKN